MKIFITTILAVFLFSNTASAAHHKYTHNKAKSSHSIGVKPGKWCGYYLRTIFGGSEKYNRAIAWRDRGYASSPGVGVIVVWPHHVGYITGRAKNGWIVKSGNDGGRVRERVRSVSGAVAFRRLG